MDSRQHHRGKACQFPSIGPRVDRTVNQTFPRWNAAEDEKRVRSTQMLVPELKLTTHVKYAAHANVSRLSDPSNFVSIPTSHLSNPGVSAVADAHHQ